MGGLLTVAVAGCLHRPGVAARPALASALASFLRLICWSVLTPASGRIRHGREHRSGGFSPGESRSKASSDAVHDNCPLRA